ncbi:hypothetical protein Avbf_13440 [Armadillidium vulgare]|nr:hypothetical protein Avbf_13440 [Armadillidium vulgare]
MYGYYQGACMFNFQCHQKEGKVVGTCIDGFLFGACCSLPPEELESILSKADSASNSALAPDKKLQHIDQGDKVIAGDKNKIKNKLNSNKNDLVISTESSLLVSTKGKELTSLVRNTTDLKKLNTSSEIVNKDQKDKNTQSKTQSMTVSAVTEETSYSDVSSTKGQYNTTEFNSLLSTNVVDKIINDLLTDPEVTTGKSGTTTTEDTPATPQMVNINGEWMVVSSSSDAYQKIKGDAVSEQDFDTINFVTADDVQEWLTSESSVTAYPLISNSTSSEVENILERSNVTSTVTPSSTVFTSTEQYLTLFSESSTVKTTTVENHIYSKSSLLNPLHRVKANHTTNSIEKGGQHSNNKSANRTDNLESTSPVQITTPSFSITKNENKNQNTQFNTNDSQKVSPGLLKELKDSNANQTLEQTTPKAPETSVILTSDIPSQDTSDSTTNIFQGLNNIVTQLTNESFNSVISKETTTNSSHNEPDLSDPLAVWTTKQPMLQISTDESMSEEPVTHSYDIASINSIIEGDTSDYQSIFDEEFWATTESQDVTSPSDNSTKTYFVIQNGTLSQTPLVISSSESELQDLQEADPDIYENVLQKLASNLMGEGTLNESSTESWGSSTYPIFTISYDIINNNKVPVLNPSTSDFDYIKIPGLTLGHEDTTGTTSVTPAMDATAEAELTSSTTPSLNDNYIEPSTEAIALKNTKPGLDDYFLEVDEGVYDNTVSETSLEVPATTMKPPLDINLLMQLLNLTSYIPEAGIFIPPHRFTTPRTTTVNYISNFLKNNINQQQNLAFRPQLRPNHQQQQQLRPSSIGNQQIPWQNSMPLRTRAPFSTTRRTTTYYHYNYYNNHNNQKTNRIDEHSKLA